MAVTPLGNAPVDAVAHELELAVDDGKGADTLTECMPRFCATAPEEGGNEWTHAPSRRQNRRD